LAKLDGLYSNLGDEIRKTCRSIIENGNAVLRGFESTLNSNLIKLIENTKIEGAKNIMVIVRQEDLVSPLKDLLINNSLPDILVETNFNAIQKKPIMDKLIVVGNVLDYTLSLFNSCFSEFGTTLLGYSWVPEQDSIGTALSELATKPIRIEIKHSVKKETTEAIDVSHFLEPSVEIASRQLRTVAKNVYAHIDKTNADEENISCRAYLLAGNHVVFLPTKEGAIDSLDLQASTGNRVQRMPINSLGIGSVILLRVGKSDSDSIFDMANSIGGKDAQAFRKLQMEWKNALKMRIASLGSQLVIRATQGLGNQEPLDWGVEEL
jgi:hypothetical protein